MTEALQLLTQKLDDISRRIQRLEERLPEGGTANSADMAPRWQYLIARPHRWRRQLSVKGRNMTVGQLMTTIRADRLTPEQASEEFDLPLAAIYEALGYYAENRALIELEAAEERRLLAQEGLPLEPKDLPR
jgi:uncharacterized protein (DUF433 family)